MLELVLYLHFEYAEIHMRCSLLVVTTFLATAVALAVADDEKKLTGTPGQRTPLPGTFQAWMVTGKHVGRFHSPVCETGLHPLALILCRDVNETDQPLIDLMKRLDQSLAKHAGVEPSAFVIFLRDGEFREAVDKGGDDFNKKLARVSLDKEQLETKLKGLAKAKELGHIGLALASEQALTEYKLDEKAAVSVLLCHQQDVLARYDVPREKWTETEAGKIADEFEKLLQALDTPARARKKK